MLAICIPDGCVEAVRKERGDVADIAMQGGSTFESSYE